MGAHKATITKRISTLDRLWECAGNSKTANVGATEREFE